MNWPTNDSPFWNLARMAVIGGLLAGFMHFGYANGFDPKTDLPTLIAVLTGLGLWDSVAKTIGTKKD